MSPNAHIRNNVLESNLEETSIDTASTCTLIGYKTLDIANQQMDINNAFFKSNFQLCPDGLIQILNSCYKFISDDNNHEGKIHLLGKNITGPTHAKWAFLHSFIVGLLCN